MATTSAVGAASSAASTSTLQSLLSSLNNGSAGINVTSTVDEILSADAEPMDALETDQTTLTNQSSAITQLESEASAVANDLSTLQDPAGVLSSVAASSSDSSVLTAAAVDGTATGTHSVTVASLATAGSYYSDEVASGTTQLASGSFTITEGGTTTTLTTGNGDGTGDTLTELASTINNDQLGVTASVVNDSNGARLSIVSQSTGSASDVSVANTGTSGLGFTRSGTGADASLKIDGVPITSASNTITGAITGLTINLQGVTTGTPVTLTLAPDSTDITSTLISFVSDYNKLITDVNDQFAYNASTGTDGTLSSDSATRSLQSDLLDATNFSSTTPGALSNLNDLGISTNNDGTLTLDSTTLSNVLGSNFSGVISFLQGDSLSKGFAASLTNTLNNYSDPGSGAFTVELSSLNNEYLDLGNQIANDQNYLTQEQTTLTTEYNNANIALQELPSKIQQTQVLLGEDSSSSKS
jgi:flagellar hook-associated protein 2